MKNICIILLLFCTFTIRAAAQDAKSSAGTQQINAVGKNTPGKSDNGSAVLVAAPAVPAAEKNRFIEANEPYHQAVITGTEKQNAVVEVNAPAQKANGQNNAEKRAIISGQTATKTEVQSTDVSQKAVKIK